MPFFPKLILINDGDEIDKILIKTYQIYCYYAEENLQFSNLIAT